MGVITPELEALIGIEGDPTVTTVELSWMRHFAQSIAWPNEPNPLHFDEEYGNRSSFGSIVAPPTYCTRVGWMGGLVQKIYSMMPPPTTTLNGGGDYEMLAPIRAGDILNGRGHLAEAKEITRSEGSLMATLRFVGRVDNQEGTRVLNCGMTLLRLYAHDKRPSKTS